MGTAFVFDPDGSYSRLREIRGNGVMPVAGLRYVASVTGPFKLVKVINFDQLGDLPDKLDSVSSQDGGSDDNAIALFGSKIRRSEYRTNTAFVMIQTRVPDPSTLLEEITEAIGSDEADVVAGTFDILAVVVDDDEQGLNDKIFAIRRLEGVKRTMSLRVMDYVSTSENAPDDHRVEQAEAD
jgi:DNA-binding Lrp family transcriptional regulator